MNIVRNGIDFAVSSFGFNDDYAISCNDVEQAVNRLNRDKSDGKDRLKTIHFISTGIDSSVYASLFLSGLLAHAHGSVPEALIL